MDEQRKDKLDKEENYRIDLFKGLMLTVALHLLLFLYPIAFFFIGIVQLIYILPALIFVRHRVGMLQGLLIGAGITFLLNAACYGIVFYNL